MCLKIQNGAIFIADAHEYEKKEDLYNFLKKIDNKEIITTQLFLMGDMFDLLVGKVECSVKQYSKYIQLIDKIASSIEVIYLEGNHDFSLETLFKNTRIISLKDQPLKAKLEDDTIVYLLHGDKFGGFVHNSYTKVIRSNAILNLLNFLDKKIDNKISKDIKKAQLKKNLCKKIENFKELIISKIQNYKVEKGSFIIEGHYHQNCKFLVNDINYINLPSFACNQSYFIVECSQSEKFAEKKLRGCNV